LKRLLAAVAAASLLAACAKGPAPLRVGSKSFTESEIVGEMVALLAESDGVKVERHFYMSGVICFESLKRGDLDAYVEYTGTGLVNLLREPPQNDPAAVYARVKSEFRNRWDLTWEPPLGFNNTYALVVRRSDAEKNGWNTISDLTRTQAKLSCGFDMEFDDRPDGWKGLRKVYGYDACPDVKQMNSGLMYDAIHNGHVDLISGYTTDGRIQTMGLKVLTDDKHFFPPYQGAPLLGPKAFQKDPKLEGRLKALAGRISDDEMRAMNAEVDAGHRPAREVAREFLKTKGLL
jgi:glycine betaine/choline ABC-type transport system substrate-binding protein